MEVNRDPHLGAAATSSQDTGAETTEITKADTEATPGVTIPRVDQVLGERATWVGQAGKIRAMNGQETAGVEVVTPATWEEQLAEPAPTAAAAAP